MKNFCLLIINILLISIFSCNTLEKGRFYEDKGGYSIIVPDNWEVVEISNIEYHVIREISNENFASNINFAVESFNVNLEDYVEAVIKKLTNILGNDFTIIKQDNFVTLSKINCKKVIISNNYLRYSYYFFQGKNNKFITAVCISLENNSNDYDILFDKIMETFRIENQKK